MPYKHLFFDLDHTLWDFDQNAKDTMQYLYQEHKLEEKGISNFDDFFEQYNIHNNKLWKRYSAGQIKQDELKVKRVWLTLLDFKLPDLSLAETISHQFLEILPTKTNLFPNTIEVLQYLYAKGYVMHIITNGFELVQNQKVKNAGIQSFFTHIITSQQAQSLKPNKEIFDYALQLADAEIEEVLMLGDNIEADISGAQQAGWDTVYINHLYVEEIPVKPTYEVKQLSELMLFL